MDLGSELQSGKGKGKKTVIKAYTNIFGITYLKFI